MTHYHATTALTPSLPALRLVCLVLGFAVAPFTWANDANANLKPIVSIEKPAPVAVLVPALTAVSAPARAASKPTGRKTVEKAKPEDALFTETGSAMVDKIQAALSKTPAAEKPVVRSGRNPASKRNKPVDTAKTHSDAAHWSYEGESGPEAWGNLKPDFNTCATGKRQSPINIEDGNTLQGPAEPVLFAYASSNGTVVNNGHTIQVDVQGENSITVRGSTYRLLQFHFHTPSEEQINSRRFPMVAHLVHKNNEGQLAVVAVLLDEGAANPLIDKVWTYMPLDAKDRVRMPQDLLNVSELLPTDQRYYQFMGSLTTPPCSEGVLWMVLKQPVTISKAQYKLFTQLYPNNARPVQPVNARPVREAL